jgi:hypothetical protein
MTIPTGLPDTHIPDQTDAWLAKFGWLLPIAIVLVVYGVSLGNYFAYDDFIWLNRARTFTSDWRQIFRPDVIYFDPLVHLMFLADFQVGGLDPRWYHGVDLLIHAVNAVLVYRFAQLLSGNEKGALYGSILFASSFAIVDAVVWPSSRVDLVSTLFALGTLIQFLRYLRSDSRCNLLFSIGLFVLALGAKGTPLVLPLVLFWLIIQEKIPLRQATCLIPFGAVIILYGTLVMLTRDQAALPLDRLHCNIDNLALALCSLFVPEEILSHFNTAATAAMLMPAVSTLALWHSGTLALWHSGTLALWHSGTLALWHSPPGRNGQAPQNRLLPSHGSNPAGTHSHRFQAVGKIHGIVSGAAQPEPPDLSCLGRSCAVVRRCAGTARDVSREVFQQNYSGSSRNDFGWYRDLQCVPGARAEQCVGVGGRGLQECRYRPALLPGHGR